MKSRIVSALIAFLLLLCARRDTLAADWPAYRADSARSCYTAEAFPNQVKLRWIFRAKHAPQPAWPTSERMRFDQVFQPIVVGDTVVFGSSTDDQVHALDAKTGHRRWTFFADGPVRFAPVAWRDRLFVASDDGQLYALALSDGRLLWKHRGGPDNRKILGNDRLISHWPARGGPVVFENTVYYAAGIWPSDGVYVHALDAKSGRPLWSNTKTGALEMNQPHGGARAKSGVSAQGYLLASKERLFVPTGRAVAAAFNRTSGELDYYHLRKNQQRGGSWAMLADQYLCNAGCLFDRNTGELAARAGLGVMAATPSGIVRAEGKSLVEYRWKDAQRRDRRGRQVDYRALDKVRIVACERDVLQFIITGSDAVCGEDGRVCAIDYTRQRNTWWSHEVEGKALGLAYASGRLIVSTDRGVIYCFDGEPAAPRQSLEASDGPRENPRSHESGYDYKKAAEEIIQNGGGEGFCVDLGCGNGELLVELAKRTKLRIYGVESDALKVASARRKLAKAGLYGVRVTVHQGDAAKTGLPNSFANLVISSRSLFGDVQPDLSREMQRILRPYGGVVCTGRVGEMKVKSRGALVGAGSWTHQNADPANTLCSDDRLVKGPLGMLWFRDVEFTLPNRHGQGPAPLYHRGVMVVGGANGLCAVDAYNGRTLWIYDLPGNLADYDGIHHDVGVGETGGVFCLSDDSVYVRNGERCLRIDLKTGRKLAEFKTPVSNNAKNRDWGYIAFCNGLLYGSVSNDAHSVSPRYKLTRLRTESISFFAINPKTSEVVWRYQPKESIRNNSIAITGGAVYLIDRSIPSADRVANPRRNGKHLPLLKPGEHQSGVLMALDARTGSIRWENDDDIFGTQLAVSEQRRVLLMNYQAVRHSFFKLPSEIGGRLAAFDTRTGKQLWSRQADYQTRPLINDRTIYAHGGAWDLESGKPVSFPFQRSYGCGQISSSANLMLFRSGTLGYLDLSRSAGTENFGGMRPGCWINAIPAGGIVLVPEGSTKCRCSYQMKTWFALRERQ